MLEEIGIPRLVVGGLGSGSGKTSISLGLTAALRARGRTVQTFKVGADFIDTAYLAHASRRPCRNLDSWLLGGDGVRRSLAHGSLGADRVIVEGAMGLLDGHGMTTETPAGGVPEFAGSTLEVARVNHPSLISIKVPVNGVASPDCAAALQTLFSAKPGDTEVRLRLEKSRDFSVILDVTVKVRPDKEFCAEVSRLCGAEAMEVLAN